MPKRVQFGFLFIALLPVVLCLIAISNVLRLDEANERINEAQRVVKETHRLLSLLHDVEVAQREFMLTGDEMHVMRIETARRDIERQVTTVENAGADRQWIELLRILVPQKFTEIEKTVVRRREGNLAAVQALALQAQGTRAMDDIARAANDILRRQDFALSRGTRDESRSVLTTLNAFFAVLLVNVALVWGIWWLTRREAVRARETRIELEHRVAQRTAELQRSNEDLQQFAYIASHDLKEPMRMIASYAQLLQRRYGGRLEADANSWIGVMVEGVHRMDHMITDLLEYSRAGQGRDEETRLVETEQVLESVLQNLRAAIETTGARVTHETLPQVRFDPMRLAQILQNLIGNAIKYRSPQRTPEIHVSAKADKGYTVLSVRDNGEGIPADQVEQVFTLFKRLHGRDVEGTGIGLAMCRRLVERFGGRIWVESQPGVGSTFSFSVPVGNSVPARKAAVSR